MRRNVGKIDQYIRIVAGLAMIAFVFKDGTLGSTWPSAPDRRDPARNGVFLLMPSLHIVGLEYRRENHARVMRRET